jgi:hypothetical protein
VLAGDCKNVCNRSNKDGKPVALREGGLWIASYMRTQGLLSAGYLVIVVRSHPSTIRTDFTPKVRFSSTLGEEREALALAVQRYRPGAEVMLVPANVLDGQVEDFYARPP